MTRLNLFGAAAATITLLHSVPADARHQDNRRELGYFLPKTRVAAGVQQQLLRCPVSGEAPVVETKVEIVDKLGPDSAGFVRVDARSGFLSGRTTKLQLRQNGTLSGFNATTTGEGGAVLSAVIGAATTLASAAVGIPPIPGLMAMSMRPAARPRQLECNSATAALVQRSLRVEAEIAMLQSRVAEGTEPPAAGLTLAGLREELASLKQKLTLTSPEPALFDVRPADFEVGEGKERRLIATQTKPIKAIDYSLWFNNVDLLGSGFAGAHGFQATLSPNRPLLDVLKSGDGATLPSSGTTPFLLYRRPVPAVVAVAPCKDAWAGDKCTPDTSVAGSAASDQKPVLLPQLSGLFHLPIGKGGMFGTRQAAATFDEQGAPLSLEYGSTTGGAEVASVINAGTAGFTTYRNAETAEINRRIVNLKARKELEELLDKDETE